MKMYLKHLMKSNNYYKENLIMMILVDFNKIKIH